MVISTVIVEDHLLFAEGVSCMLNHESDLDVATIICNAGNDLVTILKRKRIDLVLLDLNLGRLNGLDLISTIKELAPDARIIILTSYKDSKVVKQAFLGGADGFVLKSARLEELEEAIQTVMENNTFMGTGVQVSAHPLRSVARNGHYQDAFSVKYRLTKREQEILTLITQAFSNKEIAQQLFISDQTVSVHRKNIMRKLGVSNTVSLVKAAQGLSIS